jgi:predicted S18 family serine protease
MKKTVCAILTAGALACAMCLPVAAQDKDDKMGDKMKAEKHEKMEQHPAIEAAVKHLREAKNALEHANHDFGGHRVKAIEHVNQALAECEQALSFDKK